MYKKITFILLLLFLFFSTPTFANPNERIQDNTGYGVASSEPLVTYLCKSSELVLGDETNAEIERYRKNEASIPEKLLLSILEGIFSMFGVNSIPTLVFGNPYCEWTDIQDDSLVFGLFSNAEMDDLIRPVTKLLTSIYLALIVLVIMFYALKLSLRSYSAQAREEFWEDATMLVASALFMIAYWPLLNILFIFNHGILAAVESLLQDNGINYMGLNVIANVSIKGFMDIFIIWAEWTLSLYLNVIYVFRKLMVMFLIFLAPLVTASLLFKTSRDWFKLWLIALIGAIFLQSIHGLIYFGFVMMASFLNSAVDGFIFKLALLIMFIPVTSMVSDWLKMSGDTDKASQGLLQSGMKVVKLAGTAYGATRGLDALKNQATNQATNPSLGSDGGTTKITADATGSNSSGWQKTKRIAGVTGAVLGGIGGLPLGAPGAAIGAALGSKLVPGIMQSGRNIGMGAKSLKQTITEGKSLGSSLADKRKHFGNLGEAIGSMVGLGGAGKKIGHAFSKVSRQRVFGEDFGGQTFSDLRKSNPDNPVQWKQNNEGSAFYMKNGDDWNQITPTGAADPTLRNGEMRTVDYQFNNGTPMQLQENGTYQSNNNIGGLSGSTPDLLRTSNAQITDTSGNAFEDTRFNAGNINPDSYLSHDITNAKPESYSDRFANTISGWKSSDNQNNDQRSNTIV